MMIDIQYRHFQTTGSLDTEINFIDFVKLFCNHKPAYGYSKQSIQEAFKTLVLGSEGEATDQISREEFVSMLSYSGKNDNFERNYALPTFKSGLNNFKVGTNKIELGINKI